jgi:penicillin-binding protein 1B
MLRRRRVALLLALAMAAASVGVVFVLLFGAALRRVDEVLERGAPWDLPSRLYPAPLELHLRGAVPPGPLARVLEGMGYRRMNRVRNPGDFRQLLPGRLLVKPLPAWPGLQKYVDEILQVDVRDGTVAALRVYEGAALSGAVLPPAPFAEIRSDDQESRRVVQLSQIPDSLIDAVIAIEDRRFREHDGLDPRGLLRAAVVNVVRGERAQGGSTITQQLAKNYFLTQERTVARKLREVFFALALERRLSKDRILEMYLNEVYLGQRGSVAISGVGQAAWMFFSKDVADLTLSESALIAGLIQAPNALAPERHPARALARRNAVLAAMRGESCITPAAHQAAVKEPVNLRRPAPMVRAAPYFADYVAEQLASAFPAARFSAEGYVLETTLDMRIQQAADSALAAHLERLHQKSAVEMDGAVVVLEPTTGRILALVGGKSYALSQFNRATDAKRQPGSVFKPLVVLAALHLSGTTWQPSTVLDDGPMTLKVDGRPWSPRNSDGKFHGKVTLRQTLEQSLNVPTVALANSIGLERMVGVLGELPLSTALRPVPSLALGTFEATPLQVAASYTTVATHGVLHTPHGIARVTDPNGQLLYETKPSERSLFSPAEAYMVRDMMRGVLNVGTAKAARTLGYTFAAAGKTGTTNDNRDAWFVGFDRELLTVVWVGSDSALPTKLTGAKGALPIWVDIMKVVREKDPPPADVLPLDLATARVCRESAQRASSNCQHVQEELFWQNRVPTQVCQTHTNLLEQIGDAFLQLPHHLEEAFTDVQD